MCYSVISCCTHRVLLEMCHLMQIFFLILQQNTETIKVENDILTVNEEDPVCINNFLYISSALSVNPAELEVSMFFAFFAFCHMHAHVRVCVHLSCKSLTI
jgi:hypothetical protein